MDIKDYFENAEGNGILSTADGKGKVDAAIYSRPHFMDDGTIALIMRDRLTHHAEHVIVLARGQVRTVLFDSAGEDQRRVRAGREQVADLQHRELFDPDVVRHLDGAGEGVHVLHPVLLRRERLGNEHEAERESRDPQRSGTEGGGREPGHGWAPE